MMRRLIKVGGYKGYEGAVVYWCHPVRLISNFLSTLFIIAFIGTIFSEVDLVKT